MQRFLIILIAISVAWPLSAFAQTKQTFVIKGGKSQGSAPAAAVSIPEDQKLMFEAGKKSMVGDYREAEAIYNKAIDINGGNANAYLQRGIVRRELGNNAGMTSDAQRAILITDTLLARTPNDADLYYQRSLAYRLLNSFDEAERDLRAAIRLKGNAGWDNDLRALELERKMSNSR